MPFSRQQFADVLAEFRAESGRGRGPELRSATRIETACRIIIWPDGGGGKPARALTVLTRDVSPSGLGFLTSTPLETGKPFVAAIPRPGQQVMLTRYTTRHCRELADGIHAVGAAFNRVLDRAMAPLAACVAR